MNYEDLIGSLLAEIRTIFLAIIIINVLYIPIYKRCINGFLDPLFLPRWRILYLFIFILRD